MTFPIKEPWAISCDYHNPRPTKTNQNRKHSAIDLCRMKNDRYIPLKPQTRIYAPEDGRVYTCYLTREELGTYQTINWDDGTPLAFRNYFADWAGAFVFLIGERYTHIFLHCEVDHAFNFSPGYFRCYKSKGFLNFRTLHIPNYVKEGDLIGYSGNAGKSFGEHIHYEIHYTKKGKPVYTEHGLRPDPKEVHGV